MPRLWGFVYFVFMVVGTMPYKDPEKKKEWRRKNAEKQRAYNEKHKRKTGYYAKIKENEKKREKAKQLREFSRYARSCIRLCTHAVCPACSEFKERVGGRTWRNRCHDCKKDYERNRTKRKAIRRNNDPIYHLKHRVKIIKRHSREFDVKEDITYIDLAIICSYWENKCVACGSTDDLCFDHHLPKQLGYKLSIDNCVLLCRSCNSAKEARLPEEFYSKDKLLYINNRLMSLSIKCQDDKFVDELLKVYTGFLQ